MIWIDKHGNTQLKLDTVRSGEDVVNIVSSLINLLGQRDDTLDLSAERYYTGQLLKEILPTEQQWDVILDEEKEYTRQRKKRR